MTFYFPSDDEDVEADTCYGCGGIVPSGCVCDPCDPKWDQPAQTQAELEQSRRARLTRHELATEAGDGDV